MSKRMFTVPTWTPTAVASTTAFSAGGYMALQGGAAAQVTKITSILCGGQSAASAAGVLLLARDSTVGVTPSALVDPSSNGPVHPDAAPLSSPVKAFVNASTQPQRDADVALGKLALPFNTNGGVIRWVASPGEEFWIVGNAASGGEASLTQPTGSALGAMGTTISYETL